MKSKWVTLAVAFVAVTFFAANAGAMQLVKKSVSSTAPSGQQYFEDLSAGGTNGVPFNHMQIHSAGGLLGSITVDGGSPAGWYVTSNDGTTATIDGPPVTTLGPAVFFTINVTDDGAVSFQSYNGGSKNGDDADILFPCGSCFGGDSWAQALPTGPAFFYPGIASACITTSGNCVSIPINVFRNGDLGALKSYSTQIHLSSGLKLCPTNTLGDITEGGYLTAANPSTSFHKVNNGGGNYTVDDAILGSSPACGSTAASGTAINFAVTNVNPTNSSESITFGPTLANDCSGDPIATATGGPTTITVDVVAPTITGLTAAYQATGNPPGDRSNINLTWSTTGLTGVDLYRLDYGPAGYPTYTGSAPSAPSSCAPAGWTLVASNVGGGSFTDLPPTRGYWYYVACGSDPCAVSAISNMTTGTLDYHLGDVAPGTGDNLVSGIDIAALGGSYGNASTGVEYLDVGPTTGGVNGRPVPDGTIGYFDLIMFAINYGNVSMPHMSLQAVSHSSAAANANLVTVDAPKSVVAGQTFTVSLRAKGAGDMQALSAQLSWNGAIATPEKVDAGDMIRSQNGVVFSARPGNVDAALLGARTAGDGLSGEGVVATVTFRALANGSPEVALARLDARDATAQPMNLGTTGVPMATGSGLLAARPNPFAASTSVAFSLAQRGNAELAIYSVDGRRVRTLASGVFEVGMHAVSWDGRDDHGTMVKAGVFYARLNTAAGHFNKTITFVK